MRTAFVLTVIALGVGAGLANRFPALLLYIWFTLFRPQSFVWFDLGSWRLSVVLGVLLIIPAFATGIWPTFSHLLSAGAVGFFCASLLAQLSAFNTSLGWTGIDALGRLFLVSLLTITLVNSRKRFLLALAVVSSSIGFHAAKAGLGSIMAGGLRYYEGIEGTFSDNNGYAVAVCMTLFLLIATAQNATIRWVRWGFVAGAALSVYAIISTFSRGGLLGLLCGAAIFILLQRRTTLALGAGITVAAVVFAVAPVSDDYFGRVETIGQHEEIEDMSALGRLHFWNVAVKMAIDRPLGVGVYNYQAAYDSYDDSDGLFGHGRAVHSSHLQALAETGFLGFAVYIGMFVGAFTLTARIRARSRAAHLTPDDKRFLWTSANALIASMVAFLVGGAFVALAYNELTWITFALVASLDRLSLELVAKRAPTGSLPISNRSLTVPGPAHPVPAMVRPLHT